MEEGLSEEVILPRRETGGIGGPKLATPDAASSDLTFERPNESWLQQAELELTAQLDGRTVSDRVTIREDRDITPQAVVSGPSEALTGTIVQLDGSQSKEPRSFPADTIRYHWKQVRGPSVDLSSTEWVAPIFFPEEPGDYTFQLTVSSPIATSKPATFTVRVEALP